MHLFLCIQGTVAGDLAEDHVTCHHKDPSKAQRRVSWWETSSSFVPSMLLRCYVDLIIKTNILDLDSYMDKS